jgi:hypothetical protein
MITESSWVEQDSRIISKSTKEENTMLETQAELNIGLGTTEPSKGGLKPAKVKIVATLVEPTGKAKKVSFIVKHPAKEETIKLSSVCYLNGKVVSIVGTWLNLDDKGLIAKGSGLYVLLSKLGASNIAEAAGKEIDTELDDDGKYLVFKAY